MEQPAALVDTCAQKFAPMRRDRGRMLFERGAAKVTEATEHEVGGIVIDLANGSHDVYLLFDGRNFDVSCDCRGPEFCEHGYALLLAEHARRTGTKPKRAARPAKKTATEAPKPGVQPPVPAPPAVPEWTQRLRAIEIRSTPWDPDDFDEDARSRRHKPRPTQTPTWVIDVHATRRSRHLKVHAMLPRSAKSKAPSGPLPLRTISGSSNRSALPPGDRNLLRLLDACEGHSIRYYSTDAKYVVKDDWLPLVVPLLFATGRVAQVDAVDAPTRAPAPLRLDSGGPFAFRTRTERTPQSLQIHGQLHRDGETLTHRDVLAVLEGGFVLLHDRLVEAQLGGNPEYARALLHDGPLAAEPRDERSLIGAVLALTAGDPDVAPPVPTRKAAAPTPVFVVKMAAAPNAYVHCELRFGYGNQEVGVEDPVLLPEPDGDTWLLRDRAAERDEESRLRSAAGDHLQETGMDGCYTAGRRLLVRMLTDVVGAGFRVLADGKPFVRYESVRVSVATGIDWFDLDGVIEFAGGTALPLGKALRAHRRGERLVELGDGRTGLLPADWLEQWAAVLELGDADGDVVRLRSAQALLLDALLSARGPAEITTDRGFRELKRRLAAFAGVSARAAPAGFRGTLREYQQLGLGWLWFLRDLGLGGCLADDMGLGKTVQVLGLLAEVHAQPLGRPSLLVVPRSLLDNWQREAARFAPGLRVASFTGANRWERLPPPLLCEHDVVLTTYGTLRTDAAKFDELGTRFEYAILDEAQAVQNESSISSKAVRLLRANHRLALTGTPVQNHLGELWALFEFLTPGLLGRSSVFQALVGNGKGKARLDATLLRRAVAPFLLRRTKEQVLPELPPKQEQLLVCELEGSQAATYDALREHYRQELLAGRGSLDNRERFVALEALLRLRQAACHEGLLDEHKLKDSSAKLDALLPMLQEIAEAGHKALVFSQFTGFLAIVRERLGKLGIAHEYLDGSTKKRQACVDRFQQDPGCPLFLISLKAGGFGLNLTAADYVFLLDPWWNPAAEAQAIDRAHRIGQDKKVTAYRLVAKGTVEEKVLQLQAEKRALVDAVLGGDGSLLAGMTREELAALIG